jgi:hypothetical protein
MCRHEADPYLARRSRESRRRRPRPGEEHPPLEAPGQLRRPPPHHKLPDRPRGGGGCTCLTLADLSAPISPGQAYTRAAATAAACENNQPTLSFTPTITSTAIPRAPMAPPPPPAGPVLYPGPPPGFAAPPVPSLPPSAPRHTTNISPLQPSAPRYTTTAAAATWHTRAAAAREACRPVYSRS